MGERMENQILKELGQMEEAAVKQDPVRELIAAVLSRGIIDAAGEAKKLHQGDSTRVYSMTARRWVLSDSMEPYSFNWCCEQLNLDPSFLRKSINDGLIKEKVKALQSVKRSYKV